MWPEQLQQKMLMPKKHPSLCRLQQMQLIAAGGMRCSRKRKRSLAQRWSPG